MRPPTPTLPLRPPVMTTEGRGADKEHDRSGAASIMTRKPSSTCDSVELIRDFDVH